MSMTSNSKCPIGVLYQELIEKKASDGHDDHDGSCMQTCHFATFSIHVCLLLLFFKKIKYYLPSYRHGEEKGHR